MRYFSAAALALIFFVSLLYADPYRVALFDEPHMPVPPHTPDPAFWETMIRGLPDFSIQRVGMNDLLDEKLFSAEAFDLLVLPTGSHFPARAAKALQHFVEQGGDLLTSGGYAFDSLWYDCEETGDWISQDILLERAAKRAQDPEHSLVSGGDFEESSSLWQTVNPGSCQMTAHTAYTGNASAVVTSSLSEGSGSWEGLLDCVPGKHYLVGGHAKTGQLLGRGYAFLAVYQYDDEGVLLDFNDFAQISAATEWTRYEARIVMHPKMAKCMFKAGLYLVQGSMHFDTVTCAELPEEIRINAHYGKPGDGLVLRPEQLKVFSPDRPFQASADDYCFYTKDNTQDVPHLSGYEATAQLSRTAHISPLMALKSHTTDAPCLGTLVFNHSGRWRDSHWALFGVDNLNFPALLPEAYEEALLRLQAGITLSSWKSHYPSYHADETGAVQVTVRNSSKAERTLRLQLEADAAYAPFFTEPHNRECTLQAGEEREIDWPFILPAEGELPSLCRVTMQVRLVSEENQAWLCDERSTGFVLNQLGKLKASEREETRHCRFGTDFWSSTFYSPVHSPLTWNEDLAGMKAKGLEVAEMLQFCPGEYLYKEEHWRIFDGWIQLCLNHGLSYMAGLLIGQNVCIDDAELKAQQEMCRRFAERYKNVPGLQYYLNGDFKLMLSDSPDIRSLWNGFLAERYADSEELAKAWQCTESLPELGSIAVEDFQVRSWYDPRARDLTEFKNLLMERWIGALVNAICTEDPAAVILSEYYQHPFNGIDLRRSIGHQQAANFGYFDRPGLDRERFAATAKLYDMRRQGKALHLGEFGVKTHQAWAEDKGGTHYHIQRSEKEQLEFFWDLTHQAWALGFKQIQNWCWSDDPDHVFPWGINWVNPSRPKEVLQLWSALALMSRQITVDHEPAEVIFVVSDSWRSGASESFAQEVLLNAVDCLLAGNLSFDVMSENDLAILENELPKALIFPAAFALSDETLALLQGYVNEGVRLYLSGDPGIDPKGERILSRYEDFLGCRFLSEDQDLYGLPLAQVEAVSATTRNITADAVLYEHRWGQGQLFWSPLVWEVLAGSNLFAEDRALASDAEKNLYLPLLKEMAVPASFTIDSNSREWRASLSPSGENFLLTLFPVAGNGKSGSVSVTLNETTLRLDYDEAVLAAILLNADTKPLGYSWRGKLFYNNTLLGESKELALVYSEDQQPLTESAARRRFSMRKMMAVEEDEQ